MRPYLTGKMLACVALSLITFPIFSNAQDNGSITLSWGDTYELVKKHDDLGFIGDKNNGYLQVGHRQGSSLSFQKFDKNLHLKNENIIDLKNMPNDYQNVSFTNLGSKQYWFFCTWVRSEEKERLFAQEIDVRNANISGPAKEMLSSDKLTGNTVATGFYNFAVVDKWNLYFSFDSSKMLVQYRKRPERRDDSKNNDVIGFHVFDENLQEIWGRDIRMPYSEQRMDNEDYHVDEKGNVYTLAKVYNEDKGPRKKPNYRFEILKWTKDRSLVTKIPFRFTDKFVNAARLTQDAQHHIIVVGYYSSKRGSVSSDGVFTLKLDENTDELSNVMKGTYEFPAAVLKQFESARTQRRIDRKDDDDNAEASDLALRNIIIKADGSIQVYGEEYYVVQVRTNNGRGMSRTDYKYYYNDILAMDIGADGNLKWVVKIPKQQFGYNTGRSGMSFKLFPYKKDNYLFFMDNMKNVDIVPSERPAQHTDGAGGILMAVKINENGQMSKSKVFDVREEKKNLIVSDFSIVGPDQMVVRAHRRRESQPAFITFH
jgi:hypothetical protein